jgi:hypothetical protein
LWIINYQLSIYLSLFNHQLSIIVVAARGSDNKESGIAMLKAASVTTE